MPTEFIEYPTSSAARAALPAFYAEADVVGIDLIGELLQTLRVHRRDGAPVIEQPVAEPEPVIEQPIVEAEPAAAEPDEDEDDLIGETDDALTVEHIQTLDRKRLRELVTRHGLNIPVSNRTPIEELHETIAAALGLSKGE